MQRLLEENTALDKKLFESNLKSKADTEKQQAKLDQLFEENISFKELLESEKSKSAVFERIKIDLENKEAMFINGKKEKSSLEDLVRA